MPQIKTITIEYAYTYNLGNYSSVKPAATITAELTEGDDPEQVARMLRTQARTEVQTEIDLALVANNRQPYFYRGEGKAPVQPGDEPPF